VSSELIAIISTGVTLAIAMLGGFAWIIARLDRTEERLGARIDTVEARLGARIDTVEARLGARIDTVEERLGARIETVDHELVEVKIAVARIEGPRPRFVTTG